MTLWRSNVALFCLTYVVQLFQICGHAQTITRGVNIGGWLLSENWITPSLYQDVDAVDEWNLCSSLGKKSCLSRLESHWSSFYTQKDFQEIQQAGLNAVRIPIGYWAVDLLDYEPYVTGQFPYLIQAINWAAELNLSVLIDLHGAPGSQNGQENSGLQGPVLFPSNNTNVARSLEVLSNFTKEFSQSIYGDTVTGIELLNEPRIVDEFSMSFLKSFYQNGSLVIGTQTTIHDAFWGPGYWSNFNLSASYVLDTHQYYAFAPLNNLPHSTILRSICNVSKLLKSSSSHIPFTVVGEWSLETGTAPNTSSSSQSLTDSRAKRTWLRTLFEAQLAAYEPLAEDNSGSSAGWFFWSWKQEWDIDTWSYSLGLSQGWIPSNASNRSERVFPVDGSGCIDASFNYTAPTHPGNGAQRRYWARQGLLKLCLIIVILHTINDFDLL